MPSFTELYLFGSVLVSTEPNDLDVIGIYDPFACPPSEAYRKHRQMIAELRALFDLPVHLTLLMPSEAEGTDFVKRVGAIKFDFVDNPSLRHLHKRLAIRQEGCK